MKEHPILFSTPMVQAILEGRKTQTRRVVKMKKQISDPVFGYTAFTPENHISVRGIHASGEYGESFIKCPYGMKGHLLWVRESFKFIDEEKTRVDYKSQYTYPEYHKWKPSIHMPKAAARIWLQIEEVKVERLLSIRFSDSAAEGIQFNGSFWFDYLNNSFTKPNSNASFASLWVKINGVESWNANPWVWAIKFKVLSTTGAANIHAL